jgi:hypothetical protein
MYLEATRIPFVITEHAFIHYLSMVKEVECQMRMSSLNKQGIRGWNVDSTSTSSEKETDKLEIICLVDMTEYDVIRRDKEIILTTIRKRQMIYMINILVT